MSKIPDLRQEFGRRMNWLRQYTGNSVVYRWRLFILAGLAAIVGISSAVAGSVLIAMLAIEGAVLGVIGAALMLGVGIVLTITVYLWLTL